MKCQLYEIRVIVSRMICWYKKKRTAKLNLYKEGKDGVSLHRDKEANKNMNITSVTFGETKMFCLPHKFLKEIAKVKIPMHHRSFL